MAPITPESAADVPAEVHVGQVPELLATGAVLLDVREQDEWDAGHAPDAVHAPMSRLTLDDVPDGRPVLVICHLGARSEMVTGALLRAGVAASNVAGGMAAWEAARLPVVS